MKGVDLKKVLAVAILTGVVVATAGCNPFRRSSAKNEPCRDATAYAHNEVIPTLQIPAGLESPDTKNALRIPDLNTPEPPTRTHGQGCLDEPPPYVIVKPKEPQA